MPPLANIVPGVGRHCRSAHPCVLNEIDGLIDCRARSLILRPSHGRARARYGGERGWWTTLVVTRALGESWCKRIKSPRKLWEEKSTTNASTLWWLRRAGWLGVWCLVFMQGCLDLRFAGESINDGGLLSCHMGRAGREGQSLIQLNSRYFCVNPQSAISLASGVRFVRFIRSFNKKPLLPAGPAHLNIPLAPL